MFLGRVIGNVTATRKLEGLEGIKFLVIQPQPLHDKENTGLVVAADPMGAGIGEEVVIGYGRAARLAMGDDNLPIEAAVIAIVDGKEVHDDLKMTKGLSGRDG